MSSQLYLTGQTVVSALRRLLGIKFPRTQRTCLMGFLALKAKAAGQEMIRVEALGPNSVENELRHFFAVAPGTPYPLVNPFGTREGRLEYLRPEYSRAGVYTHLYPGRSLARVLEVTKEDDVRLVRFPSGAAAKIAEVKIPLEPALAFLLRNESFSPGANRQALINKAQSSLGLTDEEIQDLFISDPEFILDFSSIGFANTLAELPPEFQPPTPTLSHAATMHASRNMVTVAPRSSVQLAIEPHIQRRIHGAFRSSKAIALVGPPGTAKSWMLEDILENAVVDPDRLGLSKPPLYDRHTAEVDWSARTLIGGHYPNADGRLVWQDGHLLRAIRNDRSLWIDEMNRADLDRVLGPALTFLAGQRVDLGPTHLSNGPDDDDVNRDMVLVWSDRPESGMIEDDQQRVYYVGTDWRLLGTYNNTDMGRVFPMGAALTRRWAIVPVAPLRPDELISVLLQITDLPDEAANLIVSAYTLHLGKLAIGPAPFIDMAKYVAINLSSDLNSSHTITQQLQDAYILHLGQQVKRLDPDSRETFINGLGSILGRDLSDELSRI